VTKKLAEDELQKTTSCLVIEGLLTIFLS